MWENFIMGITVLFFLAGVAGCFVPVVPGNVVVLLGILTHKLSLGEASISWTVFLVAATLTVAAQLLELASSYWGARRFGASWQGAAGALAGGLIGLVLFGFFGLIAGPIAGAVLVELLRDSNWQRAGRAGTGTLVGGLVAFVLKLVIAFTVIGIFFFTLPPAG